MDGVPVKISEKYKPPKKISLPGSVLNKINALKESKFEDYDFRFERAVLDQIEKINSYKKSIQEKKEKALCEKIKVKQLGESVDKLSVVSPDDSPSPSSSPVAKSDNDAVCYQMPPLNTNIDILAPLPVSNTAFSKEKRKVDNAILSEFDSDTSSPFDNMELKSINDLQELADVLGSTNNTAVKEVKEKPINGISDQWKGSDLRNYVYRCQYYPGAYSGQVVPSTYPYPPMISDNPFQRTYMTDYKIPSVVPVPNSSYQPHSPSLSPPYFSAIPPPLPPKPPSLSSNPTSSYSYTSPAHSYKNTNPMPVIPPKTYLHSDSSIYDQSQHPRKSETEINQSPPRFDPAELSLWNELQTTILNRKIANQQIEQSMPQPITNSYHAPSTSQACAETSSSLPNPLSNLNQACQNLAVRISEMGFSLSRSARAVQMFNSDEAKVIEFLLLVKTYEDRDFPGDLVENVLVSNNFNEDSAAKYLENVKKLTDVGFSESQVIQALEEANNDTDQALEILITPSNKES